MTDDFQQKIQKQIESHPVVIYIKGSKEQPMCGFSAQVIQIMNQIGKPYETIDVLSDAEIRSRLPAFSKWPTFPQVFVQGKLIGGCDIVTEMYESGELEPLIHSAFAK